KRLGLRAPPYSADHEGRVRRSPEWGSPCGCELLGAANCAVRVRCRRDEMISSAALPERTPLAAATQLKSCTAPPIRGIAELGVHAPPNTAADEPRVASKTERNGVVHGSWTKRGEYAAASRTGCVDSSARADLKLPDRLRSASGTRRSSRHRRASSPGD